MDAGERALVEAAKHDPSSFAALYEAHFGRIYAFVAHRVRDRSAAEDLTAEVFRHALDESLARATCPRVSRRATRRS
jgi:RNA polymerase sigma-70 factor (ECF subfamily)